MAVPPGAIDAQSSASTGSKTSAQNSDKTAASSTQPQQHASQRQEELFDADDDMYNRTFQPGQYVDFCQGGRWHQGMVDIALDEMVKCVAAPNGEAGASSTAASGAQRLVHWIELESDALAPANSITGSDREHLHAFFLDLLPFNTVNPLSNN